MSSQCDGSLPCVATLRADSCSPVYERSAKIINPPSSPRQDIIDALANDPTIIRRVNYLEDPIIMKAWGNPRNTLRDGNVGIMAELWGDTAKARKKITKTATSNRGVVDMEDIRLSKFVDEVMDPVNRFEGFDIPTSTLLSNNMLGGIMPPGTSRYEKRNPNPTGRVPKWNSKACTQCNKCAMICPHGVVRPYLVPSEDAKKEIPHLELADLTKPKGSDFVSTEGSLKYSLQISVLDCTGCNACTEICPEQGALVMTDIQDMQVGFRLRRVHFPPIIHCVCISRRTTIPTTTRKWED